MIVSCVAYVAIAGNIPNHPECPIYKPGDDAYVMEHPTDCAKFFMCDDKQTAIEQTCPVGLEFDPVAKVCGWPTGQCTK